MLNRRQFLKAAGGALLSLTIFQSLRSLSGSDEDSGNWVGPKVKDGLSFTDDGESIRAFYDGEAVLVTNREGMRLMKLADGSRSLDDLIRLEAAGGNGEEIADFFLALGQSGWLSNRLEVRKYAIEA